MSSSLKLKLSLSVCLVIYCPHCPPPTSEGKQAIKNKADRQTEHNFKEEAIICCKEKITSPPNEWRNI